MMFEDHLLNGIKKFIDYLYKIGQDNIIICACHHCIICFVCLGTTPQNEYDLPSLDEITFY